MEPALFSIVSSSSRFENPPKVSLTPLPERRVVITPERGRVEGEELCGGSSLPSGGGAPGVGGWN